MKKSIATLLALFVATVIFSQMKMNPWQDVPEGELAGKAAKRQIIPEKYRTIALDLQTLAAALADAPMRFTTAAEASLPVLPVPLPDGEFRNFKIVEAPVMHPDLAARYPQIRSYAGWSEEDPTAYLRFGVSQQGFHAVIFSARHSTVYVDVFAEGDTENYICYFKKDFKKTEPFACLVDELPETKILLPEALPPVPKMTGDCQFRTYTLALACTGEYATFHGGTVPAVMAAYNLAMTRVNGIYEREAAVTMQLVPNTDQLIFLNANTDPYTNANGGTMLGQNQTTCDNIIGNSNYDIGHVFSTGGGGVAFLNSVCSTNNKARGVTGLPSPVGDPFWVDYVCHEMGHQFGGNHTQNNSCNRNNATAVEPGSASTIMGYAGICAPNVQNNSDDYFHAINLDEIAAHVTGFGNSCATTISSGNSAPDVSVASGSYSVPVSTPFVLTATGTDPDGDMLTYCWEQMDNQAAQMPPEPTNTGGPAFRSLDPQESPSRYFPNLPAVINGSTPTWEVLPSVTRSMFFRCTVRDNHPGAGCTAEADVFLNFTASAGPFRVTDPNSSAVTWTANSLATVTWDVANTNLPPVNCSQVDILLSLDGGLTYPFTLVSETANDGSQAVTVPNVTSNMARVMVRSRNNVFYDISDQNFIIEMPAEPGFTLVADPETQLACQGGTTAFTLTLTPFSGFNEMVALSADGNPAGTTVNFSIPNPAPPATVTMTVSDLQNAVPGSYTITVTAAGLSATQMTSVTLTVLDSVTEQVPLSLPADGANDVVFGPALLSWQAVSGATEYDVEVSVNPSFEPIFYAATTSGTDLQVPGMEGSQVYYWRVKGKNICNDGPFSEVFAFQTAGFTCEHYVSTSTPVAIADDDEVTVTDAITVSPGNPVYSVAVSLDISHTYTGDLIASLASPVGGSVTLFDRPGVPASTFGCSNDDIAANFDDAAPSPYADFENTCNGNPPSISGNFQPIQALSAFQGQSSTGAWTLIVDDVFPEDGGAIESWSLELCRTAENPPAVLIKNEILTVGQGQEETVSNAYLLADGDPELVFFTLLTVPMSGKLFLQGMELEVGNVFIQNDINTGLLSYVHDGSATLSDGFYFDVLDDNSGWLHAQFFQINILENNLAVSATLTQNIDCHNANNAVITVMASGGTAPFQYSLNGGPFQSDPVFENLGPGVYTPEVIDANGFTSAAGNVTVANPPALSVSAIANGNEITVNADGGTGALQYSLNGGTFQPGNTFSDLSNGTYTVAVMDANGCTATTTVIVAVNTLVVSASISQPISCFGENDGAITVMVGGGTPPYQYSLNGGPFQSSNIFENLGPGSYTVEATSSDGFSQTTSTILLTTPAAISASATANGYTVEVTASGGTGDLTFSLDGGLFQNSPVFFPVASGAHSIVIQDENECEETLLIDVTVPALTAGAFVSQNLACSDSNDGEITVTGTGGVPPYEYSLNGGAFQSNAVFENLSPGSYAITIRDIGGFTFSTAPIVLTAPAALTVNVNAVASTVTAVAGGGTMPYQYQLDDGNFQDSGVFPNVEDGVHLITVVDANGCEVTGSVTVETVTPPTILVSLEQAVSCTDGNDAVIEVNVTGGVPAFQYSLNGGPFQLGNIFSGLSPGSYQATVLDGNGDTFTAPPVIVNNPPAILVTGSVFGPDVTVTASGGTGLLQYSLNGVDFQAGNQFPGLANGAYTVTVMDENGCTEETGVEVNAIIDAELNFSDITCAGLTDGAIEIGEITGGIPPYLYSLNDGPFTPDPVFSNLGAGNYDLVVQDATGYEFGLPGVTIIAPGLLEIETEVTGNSLIINTSGGTGQFQYSIDGGATFQSDNHFTDLPNGIYSVIVLDENGCTAETEVTINVNNVSNVQHELAFEILPNPSDGFFTIHFTQVRFGELQLAVFDVAGRLVFCSKMEAAATAREQLDLRFLAKGSYMLQVNTADSWGVKHLIIAR